MEHLNALEKAFPTLTPEEQKMYWCKIHKLHGYFKGIMKGGPAKEAPGNYGKSWSPEDDAKVTEMWANGQTFQKIALEVGRTAWGVESHLKKMGVLVYK